MNKHKNIKLSKFLKLFNNTFKVEDIDDLKIIKSFEKEHGTFKKFIFAFFNKINLKFQVLLI